MLRAHICFKPRVEKLTREETKQLVIKALKVFFDDQKPDCIKLIFDAHQQLMYPYAVHIVEQVRQQLDKRK